MAKTARYTKRSKLRNIDPSSDNVNVKDGKRIEHIRDYNQ